VTQNTKMATRYEIPFDSANLQRSGEVKEINTT